MARDYEKSHPWLDFSVNLNKASHTFWMLLGEAQSKCEHIAGALLSPQDAQELHRIYLAKGAHATTAIEGNTLSDEQVQKILEKKLILPQSKEYLQQEVENIISACNFISEEHINGESHPLTVEEIKDYNRRVLEKLPTEDDEGNHIIPGEIREHRVTVSRYLGAPPQDCLFLLEKLCSMLGHEQFTLGKHTAIASGIIKAVIAHLYIAWIHPFGDGNGRTARLVEFKMCIAAGIPIPASHLLTNHYNETRSEYYRVLDKTSREKNFLPFAEYALQGYVDQLSEQITLIRKAQYKAFWVNYIHSKLSKRDSLPEKRQRHLMLDLSDYLGFDENSTQSIPITKLAEVSARLAQYYPPSKAKTKLRDITELVRLRLLLREGGFVRPNFGLIVGFLPATADPI